MTADLKTLGRKEALGTAIHLMTGGGYRHLPLVDEDGRLAGVVSARDLILYLAELFPMEVYNLPPSPHQDQQIDSREGG